MQNGWEKARRMGWSFCLITSGPRLDCIGRLLWLHLIAVSLIFMIFLKVGTAALAAPYLGAGQSTGTGVADADCGPYVEVDTSGGRIRWGHSRGGWRLRAFHTPGQFRGVIVSRHLLR